MRVVFTRNIAQFGKRYLDQDVLSRENCRLHGDFLQIHEGD